VREDASFCGHMAIPMLLLTISSRTGKVLDTFGPVCLSVERVCVNPTVTAISMLTFRLDGMEDRSREMTAVKKLDRQLRSQLAEDLR
jgi:hypothetical protein